MVECHSSDKPKTIENIHDPQVMSAPATSSYDIDGMALKRASETSEISE